MDGETVEKTSSSKVILSIIVILVIAAIAFALVRNSKTPSTDQTASSTNATTTMSDQGGTFSGTVFDLVSRGGDYKCTWSTDQSGAKLDGTVFISRGKFRSDVEVTGAGVNTTAHAIGDGQFVYSWSSLMPSGIKFPMAQAGVTAAAGTGAQNAQFSGSYTYTCEPWVAQSGAFALPTGITFKEAPASTQQ